MAVRIQFRRGTAAEWSAANPILAAGELGYETDTAKFKLGNGTDNWDDLVYAGVNQTDIEDAVAAVIDSAPAALDTLNELAAALNDDASFANTIVSSLSNHTSATTNVHGIANTAELVTILMLSEQIATTENNFSNAISSHANDTTNIHGIADFSALVTSSDISPILQDISDIQTDIDTLTTDKADLAGPSFTGTVTLPSTTSIGDVSATEISYLNNVTSAIQTQINAKAAIESPEFTGTVILPATTSIGDVSAAEISYLNNVTSAIQTQLDGKLDTSVASTTYAPLAGAEFTGNVVLTANTTIGTVDSTEISYLNGVTSAIQTQLDAKADQSDVDDAITLKADALNPSLTVTLPVLGLNVAFNTAQTVGPGEGQAVGNEYDGGLWVSFSGNTPPGGTFPTFPNNTIVTIVSSDPATSQLNGFNWRVDTTLTALTSGSSYSWEAVLMPVTRTSASDDAVAAVSFGADPWSNYYGTFIATVYEVVNQNVVVTQELGYLDGVTSNIQTQLDSKAALSGAVFTGEVEAADLTVTGNLVVQGTTTTISASDLSVKDNMIYLNQAGVSTLTNAVGDGTNVVYTTSEAHGYAVGDDVVITGVTPTSFNIASPGSDIIAVTSNTFTVASTVTDTYTSGGTARGRVHSNPDLGWAAGRYDNGYAHAGLFRDATDGVFKFFDGYVPEPDESVFIDTSDNTFALADVAVADLTATNVTANAVIFADGTQTKQGVPSITPISQKTDSYTLSSLGERDTIIEISKSTATTLTIPANASVAYPVGTTLDIIQTGTGQVTIAGAGGVTVNATPGLKLRTQWSSATLLKRGENTWLVYGDLTA